MSFLFFYMFDNQVATVCMPGKLAALCRELTKDQRGIVEKIGLHPTYACHLTKNNVTTHPCHIIMK
jgi:hypothetical protein